MDMTVRDDGRAPIVFEKASVFSKDGRTFQYSLRLRNNGGSSLLALGLNFRLPGVGQVQHFFSEAFDSGGIAAPGATSDFDFPSAFRLTDSLGPVPKINVEIAYAAFADKSDFGTDEKMIESGRERRATVARVAQGILPQVRQARTVEEALRAIEMSPIKDKTTLSLMRTNLRQNGLAWFQERLEASAKLN